LENPVHTCSLPHFGVHHYFITLNMPESIAGVGPTLVPHLYLM
jgi:hypothetical protein